MSEYFGISNLINTSRLPLEGRLDLTYRCNNQCRHCWLAIPQDSRQKDKELSLHEIRDLVDEARTLGCRRWSISGGEPMLRPDFGEIFDYITHKSVSFGLNTNGTLITPKMAKMLKRKGTKMVSLYGADAKVHDHITRNAGSFEATVQGMHYLKEAGTSFTVQLVPMRDNFHQYKKMVELAKSFSPDWRIGANWLYLSACRNPQRNAEIKKQRLTPKEIFQFDQPDIISEERQKKEKPDCNKQMENYKHFENCIKQRCSFHVDPYGQMSFCSFIKDASLRYNLREGSFTQGWETFIPSLGKKITEETKQPEHCLACDLHQDCKWCPVYGYLEHGKYSAKVEYLCKMAKETRQFKNNWKKNHRRFFKLGGITIRLDSDLPINDNTFDPKFKQFEVDDKGEENASLRHYFQLPYINIPDLGLEIFRKPPWIIYKKASGWIYMSPAKPPGNTNHYQIATFSKDYTKAVIYNGHNGQKIFQKGQLTTLSLFPSDPFWFAQVLSGKNGFFLHSSGVVFQGQGLLFVGHSGAGKSTMIKMIKDKVKILCDDRIIVRKNADGFKIYGTWSHGEIADVSPDDAPLKAIFFLEKASENRLSKTDKRETLKKLLACLIKPFQTAEWWEKELLLIEEIIKKVPCYTLHFDKSGQVLDLLSQI